MARKLISVMMSVIMMTSMMLFTGCTRRGEAIWTEDVCESGNIEKDDLMHVLYYAGVTIYEVSGEYREKNGSFYIPSEYKKEIDFKPQTEISGKLNGRLEKDIKQAAYIRFKDGIDRNYQWIIDEYGYDSPEAKRNNVKRFGWKRDVVSVVEYCGKYKDMHIAKIAIKFFGPMLDPPWPVYEGITWYPFCRDSNGGSELMLMIFKYK